jgi:hypothetical protein
MKHRVSDEAVPAERRAAPEPARVPRVHRVDPDVAHGDRPTYSSDEEWS